MRSRRGIHNYFIVAVMRAPALPMRPALAGRPLQIPGPEGERWTRAAAAYEGAGRTVSVCFYGNTRCRMRQCRVRWCDDLGCWGKSEQNIHIHRPCLTICTVISLGKDLAATHTHIVGRNLLPQEPQMHTSKINKSTIDRLEHPGSECVNFGSFIINTEILTFIKMHNAQLNKRTGQKWRSYLMVNI